MMGFRAYKPRLASLADPIEYENGRRRPFWITMEDRAKRGDRYASSALEARREWLRKNPPRSSPEPTP